MIDNYRGSLDYGEFVVDPRNEDSTPEMRSIGNWFETEEEAKEAVEKLKAWKRLKDAGFEFCGWKGRFEEHPGCIAYSFDDYYGGCAKDLDLLFGGEEVVGNIHENPELLEEENMPSNDEKEITE